MSYLQATEQDYIRGLIAHNIEQLYKQNKNKNYHNHRTQMEMHTINSIKNKLRENKATILKADEDNTIVIWYTDEQIAKTHEFIRNNQFSPIRNDPTNTFQKEIRK